MFHLAPARKRNEFGGQIFHGERIHANQQKEESRASPSFQQEKRSERKFREQICAQSTPNDFACIYRAWLDHSVLLFRGQNLTDDDLIAFSEKFGDWIGRRFRNPDAVSWKDIPKFTSCPT